MLAPVPGTLFVLSPMKQPEPGAHSLLWRTDTLDPTAISPQHLGVSLGLAQFGSPEWSAAGDLGRRQPGPRTLICPPSPSSSCQQHHGGPGTLAESGRLPLTQFGT